MPFLLLTANPPPEPAAPPPPPVGVLFGGLADAVVPPLDDAEGLGLPGLPPPLDADGGGAPLGPELTNGVETHCERL